MSHFENYTPTQHAVNITVVTALFLATFAFVVWFSQQVETYFNINAFYASLLFLPHGVRVLAAIIFKPSLAFIYLFIASVVASVTVWPNSLNGSYIQVLQFIVGAGCAPLSLLIISSAIGLEKAYIRIVDRRSWRVLGLATLLSALLNSLGQSVVVALSGQVQAEIGLVLTFIVGDMFGATFLIAFIYVMLKGLDKS
jgi:hypothetical protein